MWDSGLRPARSASLVRERQCHGRTAGEKNLTCLGSHLCSATYYMGDHSGL